MNWLTRTLVRLFLVKITIPTYRKRQVDCGYDGPMHKRLRREMGLE